MEISKAEIRVGQPNSSFKGLIVECLTIHHVKTGELFKFGDSDSDKNYYFSVRELETTCNSIRVWLTESGYGGGKFSRQDEFDLRDLIGLDLEKVTDPEEIARIQESSKFT